VVDVSRIKRRPLEFKVRLVVQCHEEKKVKEKVVLCREGDMIANSRLFPEEVAVAAQIKRVGS
jgi:hypothetical protein